MRIALVIKGYSLGGVSLYVSKKCTVEFAHAGRAIRCGLLRLLVLYLFYLFAVAFN